MQFSPFFLTLTQVNRKKGLKNGIIKKATKSQKLTTQDKQRNK